MAVKLVGKLVTFLVIALVGLIQLIMGFPWCLALLGMRNSTCITNRKDLVLSHVVLLGPLINTTLLLVVLHASHVVQAGSAWGMHPWEWAWVGLCFGYAVVNSCMQTIEYSAGIPGKTSCVFITKAFGVEATYLTDGMLTATWAASALLFAQGAYFFSSYVARPIEQLYCDRTFCTNGNDAPMKDTEGNCCQIIRMGIFSSQFLAAVGGNIISGYGIVKVIFISYAMTDTEAVVKGRQLSDSLLGDEEGDRAVVSTD